MPIRVDTAWTQTTKAMVTGKMALPPDHSDHIGQVVFHIIDLAGKKLADYPATRTTLNEPGRFYLAEAQWPSDVAIPGLYVVVASVTDPSGRELCRIAPRLVSTGMTQGY